MLVSQSSVSVALSPSQHVCVCVCERERERERERCMYVKVPVVTWGWLPISIYQHFFFLLNSRENRYRYCFQVPIGSHLSKVLNKLLRHQMTPCCDDISLRNLRFLLMDDKAPWSPHTLVPGKKMSNFETKVTCRVRIAWFLGYLYRTENLSILKCPFIEFMSFCITEVLLEWKSMLSIYNGHIF